MRVLESREAAMRRYTVLLYPEAEEGGYSAIVPALPGCFTQGETVQEALENVREAIEGHVASLEELGQEVPEELAPPGVVTVELDESRLPTSAG